MNRATAIKSFGLILVPGAISRALTLKQDLVKEFAHDYGKPHGLEQTLTAICEQESSYGVNMWNPKDASGGYFGNKVSTVCGRTGKSPEEVKYRLRNEPEFMAWNAVAEIYWWQTHCKTWLKKPGASFSWVHVWGHYNGGDKANLDYGRQIQEKVRRLR